MKISVYKFLKVLIVYCTLLTLYYYMCSCLQVGSDSDTIRAECVFWNFSLNDDRYEATYIHTYIHIMKMTVTKLNKVSMFLHKYTVQGGVIRVPSVLPSVTAVTFEVKSRALKSQQVKGQAVLVKVL